MSEALDTARRLLGTLEELAGEEQVLLRSLDLAEALQLAEQAEPLVEKLCEMLETAPEIATLRPKVEALVARRRANAALLDEHLEKLQGELRRIDQARRRVTRVAPVYGNTTAVAPTSRFNSAA